MFFPLWPQRQEAALSICARYKKTRTVNPSTYIVTDDREGYGFGPIILPPAIDDTMTTVPLLRTLQAARWHVDTVVDQWMAGLESA